MSIVAEKQHRDIQCADDVRKMAEMRRFDQEFAAYGTLEYRPDGTEWYHAAADEERLIVNMEKATYNGSFFTPVIALRERTPAPAGFDEILNQAVKLALLSQMKRVYKGYLEAIVPFYRVPSNNLAYPLLAQYRDEIDGYFDEHRNQLFWGSVQEAYKRKILTRAGYDKLRLWYEDVTRQMEDTPVIGDTFSRTFYGFVYLENGSRRIFIDAKRTAAARTRAEKRRAGAVVGTIMHRTCYFHTFAQMRSIKAEFGEWVTEACDERYFRLLEELDAIGGVIDGNALAEAAAAFSSKEAGDAFAYYAALWNRK